MAKRYKALFVAAALALSLLPLSACHGKKEGTKYSIQAEYLSEGKLRVEMSVSSYNLGQNALSEIPFALPMNAYRENAAVPPVTDAMRDAVYYEGDSFAAVEWEYVSGKSYRVGGEDESVLFVACDSPVYPDGAFSVEMRFTLTLPHANAALGLGESVVNLCGFYPQLPAQRESGFYEYRPSSVGDASVFDRADYIVTLTLPDGLILASGGETQTRQRDGRTEYDIVAEGVREVALSLGEFSSVSREESGVRFDYYYLDDPAPSETLLTAVKAVAAYANLFCDYPYRRYAIVQTNLPCDGKAYSGFALISKAISGDRAIQTVAHETAHQWWHALVGSDAVNASWQDEGLAEYSVALFLEKYPEYGTSYRDFVDLSVRAYKTYYAVKSQLEETDTSMSRPLPAFSGDYEYRILCYDKAVVMYDSLRQALGERRFFQALKRYAKEYSGRLAEEGDFIACFPQGEELILSYLQGRCVI